MHRTDILRNDKNIKYSKSLKEEIVNQILIYNQSVTSIAIQYGLLSKEILQKWIKSYKENDGDIIEKKEETQQEIVILELRHKYPFKILLKVLKLSL